jgi:alkyl sulfatase BDS1-like metallo-beta-lactamase superfamily hydrolase
VSDGRFEIARGGAVEPTASLATDRATLADLLWQGRSLTEAVRAGDVEIEGDRGALARFLGLFAQPLQTA